MAEGTGADDQKQTVEQEGGNEAPPTVEVVFSAPRCQLFIIKNDHRKQLASGALRILTDLPQRSELVLTFVDYPAVTHTLCAASKRPTIKMCDCDYVLLVDSADSLGLFLDAAEQQKRAFEQLIAAYCHFRVSSTSRPIHRYPIDESLTLGPPDQIALAGMQLAQAICRGSVAATKGIRRATLFGTRSIHKLLQKRFI